MKNIGPSTLPRGTPPEVTATEDEIVESEGLGWFVRIFRGTDNFLTVSGWH